MFKLMGSNYFFKDYSDFKIKDTDYWMLVEDADFETFRKIKSMTRPYKEYFYFRKFDTVDKWIEIALNSPLSLVVGKFLIPEFCAEIGFTIKDLPKLKPLIDTLDEAHLYEQVIYESYLKNGAFYLTQEQRDLAYTKYKEARGL